MLLGIRVTASRYSWLQLRACSSKLLHEVLHESGDRATPVEQLAATRLDSFAEPGHGFVEDALVNQMGVTSPSLDRGSSKAT